VVTLAPSADAEMRQQDSLSNFGTNATAVSGALGDTALNVLRRALFRFDVAAVVPTNATVEAVTVQFNVVKIPSTPASSTFGLHRLLQSWSETEVCWSSRIGFVAWNSPGASGANDAVATPSSTVFVSGINTYAFTSTTDLVADVQAWVNTPSANHGWLLKSASEDTGYTARHFATRENGTDAPVLTIQYSAPTPPAPAAPPNLFGLALVGDQIRFSFNAQSNRTYTVEFRDSLTATDWGTLTNIPALPADTTLHVTNPISSTERYFRARTP